MPMPEVDFPRREVLERQLSWASQNLQKAKYEVQKWETVMTSISRLLRALHTTAPGEKNQSDFAVLASPDVPQIDVRDMTLKDGIKTVLKEHRLPMSVDEIVHTLESREKRIGGESRRENVRATMHRYGDLFVRTDKGWTLTDHALNEPLDVKRRGKRAR